MSSSGPRIVPGAGARGRIRHIVGSGVLSASAMLRSLKARISQPPIEGVNRDARIDVRANVMILINEAPDQVHARRLHHQHRANHPAVVVEERPSDHYPDGMIVLAQARAMGVPSR